jgi:hypothetical protein
MMRVAMLPPVVGVSLFVALVPDMALTRNPGRAVIALMRNSGTGSMFVCKNEFCR